MICTIIQQFRDARYRGRQRADNDRVARTQLRVNRRREYDTGRQMVRSATGSEVTRFSI